MFPQPRRRSVDSSDSDSLGDAYVKEVQCPSSHGSQPPAPYFPSPIPHGQFPSDAGSPAIPHFPYSPGPPAMPEFPSAHAPPMPSSGTDQKSISQTNFTPSAHNPQTGGGLSSPPPYTSAPAPPPSGFRLPLTSSGAFPDPQTLGQPPCYDVGGEPIYIGSALMGNSVHPCKIGKHLQPCVAVPYGGVEYGHHGRYDLLPYRPDQMEFVPTSNGRIPYGRRPVEGGYEDHGAKLYHAVAVVNGIRVPGKTAEHLFVF